MDRPILQYVDLSPDIIKQFHSESGGVLIELSATWGEMLRTLLDQRDRAERDLLIAPNIFRLLRDYCVWSLYELKARLFHRRLLDIQRYVSAVDAVYGWETSLQGNQIFILFPIDGTR